MNGATPSGGATNNHANQSFVGCWYNNGNNHE